LSSPKEKYEETLKKITTILKYRQDMMRSYGQQGTQNISNAFNLMRKHLDLAVQNKSTAATSEEVNCVQGVLNFMLDVAASKPVTPIVRDLSMEMSKLAFNWNQQIGKCPNIARTALLLQRIVTAQKTLDDTILIAQKLLSRLQNLTSRRPVAYELSKAYLESLPKPIEGRRS